MSGIFNGIQNLINGIKTIVNAFQLIIAFIGNLVKSLIQLIQLLINTVANATLIIATLPTWLVAFATACIGVSVLYLIIGRENGKS